MNRSLHELKQIGKEFDDVARLWSTFYDGMNGMNHQTRENTRDENNKISSSDTEDEKTTTRYRNALGGYFIVLTFNVYLFCFT